VGFAMSGDGGATAPRPLRTGAKRSSGLEMEYGLEVVIY
jgi:hypothetical protein